MPTFLLNTKDVLKIGHNPIEMPSVPTSQGVCWNHKLEVSKVAFLRHGSISLSLSNPSGLILPFPYPLPSFKTPQRWDLWWCAPYHMPSTPVMVRMTSWYNILRFTLRASSMNPNMGICRGMWSLPSRNRGEFKCISEKKNFSLSQVFPQLNYAFISMHFLQVLNVTAEASFLYRKD